MKHKKKLRKTAMEHNSNNPKPDAADDAVKVVKRVRQGTIRNPR
jgi:hypothetical protein